MIGVRLRLALGLVVLLWYVTASLVYLPGPRRASLADTDIGRIHQPPSIDLLRGWTDNRRVADVPEEDPDPQGDDDLDFLFGDGSDDAPDDASGAGARGSHGGDGDPHPGVAGWFGTDATGRPVSTRVLAAPAFLLPHLAGFIALSVILTVGLGVVGGLRPKGIEARLTRTWLQANHALPQLIVLFAALSLGQFRMPALVIALAVVAGTARAFTVADKTRQVLGSELGEGLREMGIPRHRVIVDHLLRSHLRPYLVVQVPFLVAEFLLFEAALGYLGHPVEVTGVSFGGMLASAARHLGLGMDWLFVFPALAIVISIWGFHSLGAALTHVFAERNPHSF